VDESFAGDEQAEIIWSAPGTYTLRVIDRDGYVSRTTLDAPLALPGEQLAVSVMPLVIASVRDLDEVGALSALDVIAGVAQIVQVRLSVSPSAPSPETPIKRHGQVMMVYPDRELAHDYRLTEDGQLVSLRAGSRDFAPLSPVRS
jgi:hypothetical protein